VRTTVDVSDGRRHLPVYLESIRSLPVSTIEITDLIREFHRTSLVRSLYERKGWASEYVWPEHALGVSYYQMAGLALEMLAPDRDFDLVIFVTATPDCQLTHFSGPRFNEVLPGRPGFIGIGDQGIAGPFTGLRIAANHLRFGLVRRALVLVMEQAMLPLMPSHLRIPRDSAVAMVVSQRSGLRLGAGSITRNTRVETRIDNPRDALLVSGADVGDLNLGAEDTGFAEVCKSDGEYACTGVWETLADRLPSVRQDRIVVADVDTVLSYRCLLELTRSEPGPQEGGHVH